MKLSIRIITIAFILVAGMWLLDVANDRSKEIEITESVSAYNDWECGYQNQSGCKIVFEVQPETKYKVLRIRYGKDFMAIKINQSDSDGWVFSGKGVQVYASPNI